jgi:hypothetical protein
MVDHSETATAEHGREHHGAHVAGKVVGRGLGGLAMLAGAVILFGPFLLAPLTLAIQSFRAVDDPAMEWALAIGVGLGVLGLQFLFAIQRNPLVRTVTVALASFVFMVGAWLFFTRPGDDLPSYAEPLPWYERLTQTGWIVIAVGTLVYSAVYLYLLHRIDDRPWARRLQFMGGRREPAAAEPAREPSPH